MWMSTGADRVAASFFTRTSAVPLLLDDRVIGVLEAAEQEPLDLRRRVAEQTEGLACGPADRAGPLRVPGDLEEQITRFRRLRQPEGDAERPGEFVVPGLRERAHQVLADLRGPFAAECPRRQPERDRRVGLHRHRAGLVDQADELPRQERSLRRTHGDRAVPLHELVVLLLEAMVKGPLDVLVGEAVHGSLAEEEAQTEGRAPARVHLHLPLDEELREGPRRLSAAGHRQGEDGVGPGDVLEVLAPVVTRACGPLELAREELAPADSAGEEQRGRVLHLVRPEREPLGVGTGESFVMPGPEAAREDRDAS
jgi:hypothetical protein